jgi:DNA repair exonuclease SbcCD ATPase subunit
MAAVTGFALQLVMVLLDSRSRKILFLDESFGFVSEAYVDRVAEFLREVTRSAVQIVMITHNRVFAQYADVRVRLALGPDGLTQVFEGETELCRCPRRARSLSSTGRSLTP